MFATFFCRKDGEFVHFSNITPSANNYLHATLLRPNKGEAAVCGSSIFCWMAGEAITGCCKWNFEPLAMDQFIYLGQWRNISSDNCRFIMFL